MISHSASKVMSQQCSYNKVYACVHIQRNQDLIDHVEDPINADIVTVGHISLVDEDFTLKTISQPINPVFYQD